MGTRVTRVKWQTAVAMALSVGLMAAGCGYGGGSEEAGGQKA